MITNWFLKRLSEPSTWTGFIVAILASLGLSGETTTEWGAQIALVVAGIFQTLKADKGNK